MREKELTRTRLHGTNVTKPSNPQERIEALRRIVTEWQYAKIDGIMVDGFTASVIVQVYDRLNEANRLKFAGTTVPVMAHLAFKLLEKQK